MQKTKKLNTGLKNGKATIKRLLSYFKDYKFSLIVVVVCIIISAVAGVCSSLFIQSLIDNYISPLLLESNPNFSGLAIAIIKMFAILFVGVIATWIYNRIMVVMAQKIMKTIRDEMFLKMQNFSIKYFDTHSHGDIMSYYTNDTDSLLNMISSSITEIIASVMKIVAVVVAMLIISVWLTLIVAVFSVFMLFVVKIIAKKSGIYFVARQKSLAEINGYIEEMINGQKVVKVFNYENRAQNIFDGKNENLCFNATKANKYSSILMPLMNSMGYLLYVIIAFVGAMLSILNVTNFSLTGVGVITLGSIASFLLLTRNYVNPIGQVSQQLNSIIMALAGAERIFNMLDEPKEVDNGYVTLVNVKLDIDGNIIETNEETNMWAWKHPHQDGTLTYTPLKGDVVLQDVSFGYEKNKLVLHNVSIHALSGNKFALVGATGAGKTTITNLLNRFYDVDDGKIRYDGINVNKIKKQDLRRSLGMVLQDVHLFSGTVMDNIRFGKLDATDDECINAAKLANAHNFIEMLPNGYNTYLDGENGLSQGQKQLISIARVAVSNPPVMILDEATSSIDTRTESLVQAGMDALMEDRTVFVIAHRLSTIRNSDEIIVLENGRIIEQGTHKELLDYKGKYYQLYTGAYELE